MASMSRAERFDDEKRRIIESCFSKLDENKQLIESYITHLRVTEDAHYPSSPAPPDSDPSQKKQRIIIIAVKNTGRVRMHKARENSNGSYSIGKTWNLEELSAIEIFSHPREAGTETEKEELERRWAGNTGFTVTITKPYFWQAGTSKEKDFFIASTIKIYRKYTKGKVPDLKGFSKDAEQQMLGNAPLRLASPAPLRLASSPAPSQHQPQPPSSAREHSSPPIPPMSPTRLPSEPPARFNGSPGPAPIPRPFAAPEHARAQSPLRQITPRAEADPPDNLRPSPLSPPRRGPAVEAPVQRPPPLEPPAPRPPPLEPPAQRPPPLETPAQRPPPLDTSTYRPSIVDPPAQKPSSVEPPAQRSLAVEPPASKAPSADPPAQVTMPTAQSPAESEEEFRPGLGPMIKKNAARDRFRKAAAAATAFKPRPGGAAEKILRAKEEREAGIVKEPDGITGVVPRPQALQPFKKVDTESPVPSPRFPPTLQDDAVVRPLTPRTPTTPMGPPAPEAPQVEITSPSTPAKVRTPGVQLRDEQAAQQSPQAESTSPTLVDDSQLSGGYPGDEPAATHPSVRRRTDEQRQMLADIGVDPDLMEGKALDMEDMMDKYGLWRPGMGEKECEEIVARMRGDVARLEMQTCLALEANPQDIEGMNELFDEAIKACDFFDSSMTLYSAEMDTVLQDILDIEKEHSGLQVVNTNLKALHACLANLLSTINIENDVFQTLHTADLSDPDGLEDTEVCLEKLWHALVLIEPSIAGPKEESDDPYAKYDDMSDMMVVRERRTEYFGESDRFCARFIKHLESFVSKEFNINKSSMIGAGAVRLNREAFTNARKQMWVYRPVNVFVKSANPQAWTQLLKAYQVRAQSLYADTFGTLVTNQKKHARKPTGEEAELLFTHIEPEEASNVGPGHLGLSAARKLTVKRSQTLAKSLRNAATGELSSPLTPRQIGGGKMRHEAFAMIMDEIVPVISQEQNFLVDFFHASSTAPTNFVEIVRSYTIDRRRPTNLMGRKPYETDREMAKRVNGLMDDIFRASFQQNLTMMLDWTVSSSPIEGLGLFSSLEKQLSYLNDDSQEYIKAALTAMRSKVQSLWTQFIDNQVKAIDDTKILIKKRKGVIPFMRVFERFYFACEAIMATYTDTASRKLLADAYERIISAMFATLTHIAKSASEGPEEKELLNHHILMIENMTFFLGVTDGSSGGSVASWRRQASTGRTDALNAYVASVLRRPLGTLLTMAEGVERVGASAGDANLPPRKNVRAVLGEHGVRELRRGVETLMKRAEKHFGEGDDTAFGQKLLAFVLKEVEQGYVRVFERLEHIARDIYPPTEGEKPVEVGFSRADIEAAFRR